MSVEPPWVATVVALFRQPCNNRALERATHAHEGVNAMCGDRVRMEAIVRDDTLADVGFTASACAIAIASASLLTEHVRGATLADALAVDDEWVFTMLGEGVPTARRGCATLPLRVLRAALRTGA